MLRRFPVVPFVILAVALTVVLTVVPEAAPARAAGTTWVRPVPGPVVRPYAAPEDPYAAGHRVADLATARGEVVRAAGPGRVTFVGSVGGVHYVVLRHAGDRRTSYSDVDPAEVAVGDRVVAGQVVGRAAGTVLHFGLRIGVRYADPMALFAPIDLRSALRLRPPRRPGAESHRDAAESATRPGSSRIWQGLGTEPSATLPGNPSIRFGILHARHPRSSLRP